MHQMNSTHQQASTRPAVSYLDCRKRKNVENQDCSPRLKAIEFFAGIGLVRKAIERAGFEVVFANDISTTKMSMYQAEHGLEHFLLGDIRNLKGGMVPQAELATASFPCTDLSLAGGRVGLSGTQSGMFWEFARVLKEMRSKPTVLLIENVAGLASSNGGEDLAAVIACLNKMRYCCDVFTVDAVHFLPQSRPRLFIVASRKNLANSGGAVAGQARPAWLNNFLKRYPRLNMQLAQLPPLPMPQGTLRKYVERLRPTDSRWWDSSRKAHFLGLLSPLQAERLKNMTSRPSLTWATAYRRTRGQRAVWEIRPDEISGCLRTGTGGSSRQAVVEAGKGSFRVRSMTGREYARLQGAGDFAIGAFSEGVAILGFGDAVCVPVVEWIAKNYIRKIFEGE